jgi:hypothetical protein
LTDSAYDEAASAAVETDVARRAPCDSVTPQNDIVVTGFCFICLFLFDKKNEKCGSTSAGFGNRKNHSANSRPLDALLSLNFNR